MSEFDFEVRIFPPAQKPRFTNLKRYLPFLLFGATLLTTLFAGAMMQYVNPKDILKNPLLLSKGAGFGIPLMIILLTHEMGHYVASRIHRVDATLPYFIPFPNYIGTFGAVIKMKSPMRNRLSLIDIGAAGPIAGFVLSLIAAAWGIAHATVLPMNQIPPDSYLTPRIAFGPNIIFAMLMKLFASKEILTSNGLISSPIMDAGWLGMFVTSLNLMPAGQLDGGHISYALFGPSKARKIAKAVVGFLIIFGLPGFFWSLAFWPGYAVWGILVVVIGLKHPPPLDTQTPLNGGRKIIGLICIIMWLLTFTPMPFLTY